MNKFIIGIVDDKSDDVLGYVTGYRRGGYYHPGSIIQGVFDADDADLIFDDLSKAQRRVSQYKNYSEVFMYDPTSTDYPMPSEKWSRRDVPTHLEILELEEE